MNIAEIRRPEALRWLVLIAMAALAALLFMGGIGAWARAPMTTFVMLPISGVLAWFAAALWRTRARAIRFDGETLTDDAGEVICTLDEIEEVNRGFILFKPTKGFVVTLKAARPWGWSPGLWWRLGRRIGVGGSTPGRGARDMADAITGALAMRAMEEAGITLDPPAEGPKT